MAKEDKLIFEVSAIDTATKVFNQVGAAAKNLQNSYAGLQKAFGVVVAALSAEKIVTAATAWEQASNRLNAVLRATQGAAGLTRRELDEMAESLTKSTQFDDKDIRNAESNLLKFGNIHEEVFKEALKLAADYAAFTGGDMVGATQAIGRALQDPVLGLKALQKEVGTLTFAEKQYIQQLESAGKVEEAQVLVLNKIRGAVGGVAAEMNTGLTKATHDLNKAWDELLKTLGNQSSAESFLGFAAQSLKDIQNIVESPSWLEKLSNTALFLAGFRGMTTPELDSERQRTSTGRIRTGDVIGAGGTSAAEDAASAAAKSRATEAQNRLNEAHARAVPTLAAWTRQLSDTTREEQALTLVLEGEAKTWTDLDKVKLLNTAVELDRRKQLEATLRAEAARLDEIAKRWEVADEAQRHFVLSGHEVQGQLEFETRLIGLTTQQQERLTAAGLVDVRARDAIAAGGDRADILREAQRQKEAILAGLQARRDAERSWAIGTKNTFNEYIDHATNAAEQASFLFTNAFKNMEDGLVEFARTGKLDFRSFADSVIADLIRIQVRQALAGFASSTSGFFAGLGGGVGSAAIGAGVDHAGGIVGQETQFRQVPVALFHGAPRYHLGGLAGDEVPAILQRGERVIPRGGSGAPAIHIHQTIGGNVTRADLAATAEAARRGTLVAIAEERRREPGGPFGG
jgi:lambda family phage tail tape measure protein